MEGMVLRIKMRSKKNSRFVVSYDLGVINTYFRKKEEHYITYKK